MTGIFLQAFVYLLAAVLAVPLAKRLGLGSVLGYLVAGVAIGPLLGLVGQETQSIQHFAEFGVVLMLFLVGLELDAKQLWQMRQRLLGLGGLQVLLTTGAVAGLALILNQPWQIALALGMIFAMSSTAIVLQSFNEKGLAKTEGGRGGFSVLLFQDIAVIPILAILPLLALGAPQVDASHEDMSLVAGLPGWANALVVLGAIAAVVFGGRFLTRLLFGYVARSGLREVFTAAALMMVIGIAALMSLVGLSPALGTFLAGVVLASSEFRHELESTIEPFKGLLLGLFFITVGAGIDFEMLLSQFALVLGLALGVMVIKALVLLLLAKTFRLSGSDKWLFALSLAQAGEFGFVLLGYSQQQGIFGSELGGLLSMVVALSMFLTPGLFILYERVILPRVTRSTNEREADTIDEQGPVIIAGIGRFGQIVNRLLRANGVKTVVLDREYAQVERLREIEMKSFFGDVSNPELLHTAGIESAKMLVVAIDDVEGATALVRHVRQHYPQVAILARAFDRGHFYALTEAGADWVVSESFYSALNMGGEALIRLGIHPFAAEQRKTAMVEREKAHASELYEAWLEVRDNLDRRERYLKLFIKLEAALKEDMGKDRMDGHSRSLSGWTPPPKGYDKELASQEESMRPQAVKE
ncbi:monovalent cation:proton antiporter-2 (CPA2) family protein [Shewanella sp. FJAT-52076]|uniref:monovalent cation:proton antiporter-2 (CPA2) family protein n=1 Tax=Shewanella sp. FJAT-52076 TaxID=2864202 RepID=UPI001C65A9E7|nr:monovalent cation:proton antiporter-2 (CPA2) family protein [Shewanella sp. FJAT-52076]QYJ76728.1 monovalent cation:proton antiporter-2 (CPA2) family protein [Shewanella sp. FJAT-52076]